MNHELDSRTWLLWGGACMLPLLISRNPWIAVELAIVIVVVRSVAVPVNAGMRTGWFIRLAAVMALIGAGFNVMTVRAGNLVLVELPDTWPVVGGAWTLNALIYGLVGGFTLFVLVLAGITTATMLRWMDLFHILPRRLAPLAVTGSVAWSFLPQTAIAWQNIHETMAMRGHRLRSIRDFIPLVVPLLAGGLERSLVMAEALESRGFGASQPHQRKNFEVLSPILLIAGLTGVVTGVFLLATAQSLSGLLTLIGAVGALLIASRLSPPSGSPITTYEVPKLHQGDLAVMAASTLAITASLAMLWLAPEALTLSFYPTLTWPDPVPLLLLALSPLILPAMLLQPKARNR